MEYILAIATSFLLIGGMMYAVSTEGDNPTPTQIRNRIIFRRWVKKWKRKLTPDEIIFPMLLGIIILGVVGYLAIKLGGA
tara:strand:- start:137 stop:376 length:240 start_codon:yes stop_codon:yes gene_type:complete